MKSHDLIKGQKQNRNQSRGLSVKGTRILWEVNWLMLYGKRANQFPPHLVHSSFISVIVMWHWSYWHSCQFDIVLKRINQSSRGLKVEEG